MSAAQAAVGILMEHMIWSSFADEIQAAARAHGATEWYRRYTTVLGQRFEADGIMHGVRVWRRWLRWRGEQATPPQDHPASPLPLVMATWLDDEAARGPTVQRSLMAGMKWLQAHLGLKALPLASPLLTHFSMPIQRPVEKQAEELPLRTWVHLLDLAERAKGVVALMAGIVLYITATCLRFRHAQRHRFVVERCSREILVGEVARGKVRRGAAFMVAGPTHIGDRGPVFWSMFEELAGTGGRMAAYLVPDVVNPRGEPLGPRSELVDRPMAYNRFMGMIRALAMAPPLAMSMEDARRITSYSLRRKLPTVADRLGLPLGKRAELGDWKDVVAVGAMQRRPAPEPMAVRYSAARLVSSARTRAQCMHAMCIVAEQDTGREDELTRTLSIKITSNTLNTQTTSDTPLTMKDKGGRGRELASATDALAGPGSATDALVGPGSVKRQKTRENEQESKGEKEDSNSSGDEEERASSCSAPTSESSGREGGLHWLLPKGVKTRIHRASGLLDDAASAIPRCRVTSGGAFTWGYEEGHSMGSALDAGRKFCRRCFPEV